MAVSRYDMEEVILNDDPKYKKIFEKRGVKKIYQYETPRLKSLTPREYAKIKTVSHIWTLGDKYFKLADRYYQDPKLWWLIAWFNQKPTDAHLNAGDPIFIPIPAEDALYYYNTR